MEQAKYQWHNIPNVVNLIGRVFSPNAITLLGVRGGGGGGGGGGVYIWIPSHQQFIYQLVVKEECQINKGI